MGWKPRTVDITLQAPPLTPLKGHCAAELDLKSRSLSYKSIFEGQFFPRSISGLNLHHFFTSYYFFRSAAIAPDPRMRLGSVEREELLGVIKEEATCTPASSIYLTLASSGLTAYPVLSHPSKHTRASSYLLFDWGHNTSTS